MKTHYLFIGNGRLSRHLQYYFSLLGLQFTVWTRQSEDALSPLIAAADRICLAISDDALTPFAAAHPELKHKAVHFSGSQNIPGILSAHPLMTFGPELYAREVYLNIPFITIEGEPSLRQIFPELLNPAAKIRAEQKALYHAYCVMGGNFTTLLWQNIFKDFSAQFGLGREFVEPYLRQITANLLKNSAGALTGPIARGDVTTIERNLKSIAGTPYENIYYAFLNLSRAAKTAREGATHEYFGL